MATSSRHPCRIRLTTHRSPIDRASAQIRVLSLVDDAVFEMVHQTKGLASPVSDSGSGCDDAHAAFLPPTRAMG